MKSKDLKSLTDEELLQEAKKRKSTAVINAVLIGILVGIIFYSIVKNSLGFLTLIPLFFAFKISNNSKYDRAGLENELRQRNLK
jgi:hypothetical protein